MRAPRHLPKSPLYEWRREHGTDRDENFALFRSACYSTDPDYFGHLRDPEPEFDGPWSGHRVTSGHNDVRSQLDLDGYERLSRAIGEADLSLLPHGFLASLRRP